MTTSSVALGASSHTDYLDKKTGVFVVQWGIGLLIDGFASSGLSQTLSFQAAMVVYLCCCIASYAYFLSIKVDNSPQ